MKITFFCSSIEKVTLNKRSILARYCYTTYIAIPPEHTIIIPPAYLE